MRVIRAIETDVEVAGDVNRYLISSCLFRHRSELLEQALLYSGRAEAVQRYHDVVKLSTNDVGGDMLERGRRRGDAVASDDSEAAVVS